MRFDRGNRPTPWLNRRDQYRLMTLVGGLALVVGLASLAADPERWRWFEALSTGQPANQTDPGDTPPAGKPIVVRRTPTGPVLPPETYFARVEEDPPAEDAADPDATPGTSSSTDPGETASAIAQDDPSTEPASSPETSNGPAPQSEEAPPLTGQSGESAADARADEATREATAADAAVHRLDLSLFEGGEDDWLHLTRREQNSLARLSEVMAETDIDQVSDVALTDITFDALRGDPDYYRGRWITITGRLKRLVPRTVGLGDTQRSVWEAWVLPRDSRNVPYFVLVENLPAGITQGQELDQAVRLTGVLVRRYAYDATTGQEITLLLAAPTLEPLPEPPPVTEQVVSDLQRITIFFAVAVLSIVALLVGWFAWSNRRFRNSRLHQIAEQRRDVPEEDLKALSELDSGDPHKIQIPD